MTVDNIREANAARNITTISLLRRFGLAEDQGRGIDVMQDTMAEEMLDPPRFTDNGHEVTVTLPLRSTVAPAERAGSASWSIVGTLAGPDRIALVHAARGEVLTNARVRQLLGVDRTAATDVLGRLRYEGLLEQRGQRAERPTACRGSLRPPAGLRLTDTDLRDLVVELAAAGPIANADVRAATGLDRAATLVLLEQLLAEGRLVRTGNRRGTRYHPA